MGPDDTSSNPTDDAHLPVSGEFDSVNQPDRDETALSTSEDDDLTSDPLDDEDDGLTDEDSDELSDEDDEELQTALAEDKEMPDVSAQESSDPMEKDGEEMQQP